MRHPVLSLNPPYGTLIAACERFPDLGKHIETRDWATTYRGPLLIHQTKGLGDMFDDEAELHEFCYSEPAARNALKAVGYHYADELPRGAIVAVCELVDCVPTQHPNIANEPGKPWFTGARKGIGQHYFEVPPPLDSNEYAFGDYAPGRFAWLLADVRALPVPIAARGMPGLWEWEGELGL